MRTRLSCADIKKSLRHITDRTVYKLPCNLFNEQLHAYMHIDNSLNSFLMNRKMYPNC